MNLIPVLVCAAASLLFAFIFDFWLRSRKGTGEGIARIYAIGRGRILNFWSFQYGPIAAAVVILSSAAGFAMGWKYAAVCAAGAVTAMVPLILGSASYASGVTAAYNGAVNSDIRQSIRAGYRSGAVTGSLITGICLPVLCAGVFYLSIESSVSYSASFALGASAISLILHTGGEVYSSAYALAATRRDFADRSGIMIAAGSDFASAYITSAASAVILSDVAVATSGVTSSFSAEAAAAFPLLVFASGIAGSVIGAFVHRAGLGNDPSRGAGLGCIAAGIITVAGSVYFSSEMMQSRVYAWAAASGVVAGLIYSIFGRTFSSDRRIFINGYKTDKGLGRYSSVVFNLGTGMISTSVSAVVLIVSVGVSYMFANYYGVAVCAVGLCSILGSVISITGIESVTGTAADIIHSEASDDELTESSAAADVLDIVSLRNGMMSKSYGALMGTAASLAAFCALFCFSGEQSVDIMTLRVFCGIIAGFAAVFLLAGIIIGSVRLTGRVALRDIGRNDDETGATSALRGAVIPAFAAIAAPALIGLLIGAPALTGFVAASTLAGYFIVTCILNSGMYFENTAVQSLSSIIRMMTVFSLAFLPFFLESGGILFS